MITLINLRFIKIDNIDKWVKVFKNEPRKICGRKPLKNLK